MFLLRFNACRAAVHSAVRCKVTIFCELIAKNTAFTIRFFVFLYEDNTSRAQSHFCLRAKVETLRSTSFVLQSQVQHLRMVASDGLSDDGCEVH